MAYAFPLGLPVFWNGLKIRSLRFELGEALTHSETQGGEILPARTGARLWSGEAEILPADGGAQDAAVALVDLIRGAGASFLVADPRRTFAAADPDGTAQGSAVCRVASRDAGGREVTFRGLPAGWTFTPGDHVTIAYGSSPIRYYLGRVVAAASFAGSPAQCVAELVPPVPAGVVADDLVTLKAPFCKAVYVPASFSGFTRDLEQDGAFTFAWRQTLR